MERAAVGETPKRAGPFQIAKAVLTNHPEVAVIVLLVDERPEEVTDFRMLLGKTSAEIVASSNDNPYARHIEVTEQVLERVRKPFLDHKFADIALQHESKVRVRLAPTAAEYAAKFGKPPPLLSEVPAAT